MSLKLKRGLVIVFLFVSLSNGTVTAQSPAPITKATVSHILPTEVVDGQGLDLPVDVQQLPLQFFDDFSWRTFIAVNWPGKDGIRGVADDSKEISDEGVRVWETWKSAYEIFQPMDAANPFAGPSPWDSFDAVAPCSNVAAGGSGKLRLLGSFSAFGFGDFNQASFGSFMGPLVDQSRKYVRYEIKVNKPQYEKIRNDKLYLQSTLDGLNAPSPFPDGSMEIKASWRIVTGANISELRKRFYITSAKVLNPVTGQCEDQSIALVGMHIVHKTPLRPQWVWSSFEHIDNVPKAGTQPAAGEVFSFNNPAEPQTSVGDAPPVLTKDNFEPNPNPVQVIRELPLIGEGSGFPHNDSMPTTTTNKRYQTALAGTVWANYQLVLTQWPTKTKKDVTIPNGNAENENISGDPFPDSSTGVSIGNSTMETYLQSTDCMQCHDFSRDDHTDFVFFLRLHALNDSNSDGRSEFIRGLDLKIKRSVEKSSRFKGLKLDQRIEAIQNSK